MGQSNGQFARSTHYGHLQVREMSADVSAARFIKNSAPRPDGLDWPKNRGAARGRAVADLGETHSWGLRECGKFFAALLSNACPAIAERF
jgi:hypothetical protein